MFTIYIIGFTYLRERLSLLQISSVFQEVIMHYQSKCYELRYNSQHNFTLKSLTICIKSGCNLYEITASSDSNSNVTCIKLQSVMNEIAHPIHRKYKIMPAFWISTFYLVAL